MPKSDKASQDVRISDKATWQWATKFYDFFMKPKIYFSIQNWPDHKQISLKGIYGSCFFTFSIYEKGPFYVRNIFIADIKNWGK